MITSLLVANRGEIACRIFRTARRLGVRTIAVFSDVDVNAQHVREADEAFRIGPAAARDSYLNIERLLAAARSTGAQAIHPGYGFLSENAHFARACTDAGLVFVGPPASAIEAMGSKVVAKARMRAAGVPVLPGYEGSRQDLQYLESAALELGLPLIIKPAAGGGGKGMRIIREKGDIAAALVGARRLAESAFGNGVLLLERFLPAPRHVEVQVFADTWGHFVHLGDRDCSIQRRHQKLIEEAPAPAIPAETRDRLRAAALLVAREIGYVSAGTVEFLFDGGEFFFMEMNTRLQVEHTVTEAITGLDLLEWQLRVASGEPLPLTQEEIRFSGHAMEARVCAEDPDREFLPSAGNLRLLHWPTDEFIRTDAGFASGDSVPATYDSLLGKVISWAPERTQAAARLSAALDHIRCVGVHTNDKWLSRILQDSRFLAVNHTTAFLQEYAAHLSGPNDIAPALVALAALTLHTRVISPRPMSPWEIPDGFMPNLPARITYNLIWRERQHSAEVIFARGRAAAIAIDSGAPLNIENLAISDELIAVCIGSERFQARYFCEGSRVHLWAVGEHFELALDDPREREFSATAVQGGLTTPLPGVVTAVSARVGQSVTAGEVLMVIEAMKMEHSIRAPNSGVIKVIHFGCGDRVPEGSQLLELAPEPTA